MDEVKIGEILEPGSEDTQSRRERRVRSRFWPKVKRYARMIPFVDEVVAAYFCALDPQTPPRVRGILLAALAYFILPLDSIPDFIIGVGFGDDIAVLTAAFAAVRGNITEAHRAAARRALAEEDIDTGEAEEGPIIDGGTSRS
ncbi:MULTISPECIES: YkvA family protein [unclassified Roseitalea]|uniref:YkvA family protein n=1 Tax=unclassified Roseitalea TaxID=2639107 RepID=UPI00273D7772|nr:MULTISPECIES: YkvA family protein [unclassified Roseitalea]